jgi:hypothetical protein
VNILLLLAHSIEEYDQLRLLSGLGYDVFSIGGYIDPAHPHDSKRPALSGVPYHPELHVAVDAMGTDDNLRYAKEAIPETVLDWADTIICHHYEHTWLVPQWSRLRGKRVIWRTVGQSVEGNERMMAPLRDDGLQIVRYSPKERNIPGYAGEDALIRFYKDPDEWHGWTGESPQVLNITQELRRRDPYTNWAYWEAVTAGLNRVPAGPGSEEIGGTGEVSLPVMKQLLRQLRCYLYTGTQPASYTLGLIEAMMTGIPVISIGPSHMRIFPYGPAMFEGHEITRLGHDSPAGARDAIQSMIKDWDLARSIGAEQRTRAIDLFGMATIGAQWQAFLG